MTALKIGIVEDEAIIADAITEMLLESGYRVTAPAARYSEAVEMIENEAPDLLLLDVRLQGRLDGIDLARTVREKFHLPFIFLTANTDFDTIARAKDVSPSAFLAKPVTRAQLFAAIEIAMAAPNPARPQAALPVAQKKERSEHLFLNDGRAFKKVMQGDILFAESEENYMRLYLADGKTTLTRMTITALAERLDSSRFLRVHRSYIIALSRVGKASADEVTVGDRKIPVSKTYRDALFGALGLK